MRNPFEPRRYGKARRVKILPEGGLREFWNKTGTAYREDGMWRVFLDEPVNVEGVGEVNDDLWSGEYLSTLRAKRSSAHE